MSPRIGNTSLKHIVSSRTQAIKAKISHLNNRLFENHRHFDDNKFRTLTYAKFGFGITTAYAGMSLGTGLTQSSVYLGTIWIAMVFARNVLVDIKTRKPAIDDSFSISDLKLHDNIIRRRKLANDMFMSGLSSIPVVGAKLFLSDEIAQVLNAGIPLHVAMDIACVSLVGGSLNYIQRICRGYSSKVAFKDMFRSLVMSVGAYAGFGAIQMMPSAELFAIARKTIGEGWAAYAEYPEVRRSYKDGTRN